MLSYLETDVSCITYTVRMHVIGCVVVQLNSHPVGSRMTPKIGKRGALPD